MGWMDPEASPLSNGMCYGIRRGFAAAQRSVALLGLSASLLGDTLVLGFREDPLSAPNDGFGYKAWLSYRVVVDPDTNAT